MKYVQILIVTTLISSCSSLLKKPLKTYEHDYLNAIEKIQTNDFNEFKNIMKKYLLTDQKVLTGLLKASTSKVNYKTNYYVTKDVNFQQVRTEQFCRPKFLDYLLKKDAKLQADHIKGIFANLCTKSFSLIKRKVTPLMLKESTKNYTLHAVSSFTTKDSILRFLKPIMQITKQSPNNKDLIAVKNNLIKAASSLEKELKSIEYYKTPAGIEQKEANSICYEKGWEQKYKKYIVEEKRRGKLSGFVNAIKLKKWGDYLYQHRVKLKQKMDRYQFKYKERFNIKRCR
ncbi:MAG: hypothetical protein N4A33_09370 [Bacteriovoracaceae bacterium]|jgi:hypothetical protein|nr:hypothetical protein [Bacteriovoracaceae bacterium]